MAIKKDTLDQLLSGRDPKDVFSKDGLFDELKKALAERVLNAELDDHLEGEAAAGKSNHRNGYSKKTVLTETSKIDIKVPRDREGSFDPKLIARYQRRFPGFDEKIVSMYARGMTVREIQGHLLELYGLEVSPDLISTITDAVLETVAEWQNRPLEAMYPLVFFDALRVKIRDEGLVRNKAVYVALGVTPEGTKDILGLWIETSEGAKFWLRVMNELKNRGVEDILIAVVDGLKGFPEAINAVFQQTVVQTCIVHLIRNSMDFASWKDRKADRRRIEESLPGERRRRRQGGARRFRRRPLGQEISVDRPKLAAKLGAGHPVFRLSRRGAADHLYDQRHRILERETAARRANAGAFSNRRRGDEIAVSRLAPGRGRMENATARMVRGKDPIRHHVRRKVRHRVMVNPAPHTKFRTLPCCLAFPRRRPRATPNAVSSPCGISSTTPSTTATPARRASF